MTSTNASRAVASCRLALQLLEDRLTPALTFQFNYDYDTTGFFSDPSRRMALERAGQELASRLDTSLNAIAATGNNRWTAVFAHPVTSQDVRIPNLSVPADTLLVFAGGLQSRGNEAGLGGPGGYSVTGGANWQRTVATRGVGGFSTWGGSVSFSPELPWYFGADPTQRPAGQYDFHTVAVHELGHTLGIGTSAEWHALVSGNVFTGPATTAAAGGPVYVSADKAHFAQGTKSDGQSVSMQPILEATRRIPFSTLDYAALRDIGWQVRPASVLLGSSPLPVATPTATPVPTPTSVVTPSAATAPADTIPEALRTVPADRLVLLSGPTAGTVQAYATGTGGLTPIGSPFQPFGNFDGAVRTVAADVNGDGAADFVLATGPFGGSRVRVLDGRTFADLVPEYWAFESSYTGGVYLAAADFDGDGRAEIVITPDIGGGPRVQVVSVTDGQVQKRADFWGLSDPAFRGGARAAAGDLNRDGVPDLVIAAGSGGGPRVAVLDGRSVLTGGGLHLTPDFFAFDPSLRNGVYVAIGDTTGDGFADLILGAGPGGGPRVLTLSGQTLTTAGPAAALAAPLGNTFAGDPNQRGGVRVSAKDVNGDGLAEIFAGAGVGGTAYVLNPRTGYTVSLATAPFGDFGLDGIYVG